MSECQTRRSLPLIIAHRGYSSLAPENTLAAFRAAIEAGAPAAECDVHCTRDSDVVVIHDPGGSPELLIKRIVGLPGERVTVADGRVYIDGQPLNEPYLTQPTQGGGQSWVVPPLSVFVMGDNRDRSCDARYWGPVGEKYLKGRAWFLYWPPSRMKTVL